MALVTMQMRRGLRADFDPYKMLPGEWAVSIDAQTQSQIVWMCFAAGVVKRMGTYEDFMAQIEEITNDILEKFIQILTEAAHQLQDDVESYIQGKVDDDWIPELKALVERAEASEKAAVSSASAAKESEDNAKQSEQRAYDSADTATQKAEEASQSASVASQEAQTATEKVQEAENYSKLSESWAHGNTGVRSGENTNNSEYFSSLADKLVQEAQKLLEQAQKIVAAATQGALIPAGTITFEELPINPEVGYMYNISDDFTTDSRFAEGPGIFYRAGANVYWTKDGKWDVMIGAQVTGVKGNAESDYHIGNVNLTPVNIGAVAIGGDTADNTITFTSVDSTSPSTWDEVALLTSGEKHNSILNKISNMFKNVRYLRKTRGDVDISAIGDGTVTGAIGALNDNLIVKPSEMVAVTLNSDNTSSGAVNILVSSNAVSIRISNVTIKTAKNENMHWALTSNIDRVPPDADLMTIPLMVTSSNGVPRGFAIAVFNSGNLRVVSSIALSVGDQLRGKALHFYS